MQGVVQLVATRAVRSNEGAGGQGREHRDEGTGGVPGVRVGSGGSRCGDGQQRVQGTAAEQWRNVGAGGHLHQV